jgi:hypothetical protein
MYRKASCRSRQIARMDMNLDQSRKNVLEKQIRAASAGFVVLPSTLCDCLWLSLNLPPRVCTSKLVILAGQRINWTRCMVGVYLLSSDSFGFYKNGHNCHGIVCPSPTCRRTGKNLIQQISLLMFKSIHRII